MALALPARSFDPCVSSAAQADKYQTVRFQTNRYSVPRWAAFQGVTIKAYVDRIQIVCGQATAATHARSYGRDESILDPLHYLAALGHRPGALDHSGVFKDWKLPAIFGQLRQRLEQEHGPRAGVRHYIRVLQLLNAHRAHEVGQAIGRLWHRVHLRAEDIEHKLSGLSLEAPAMKNPSPSAPQSGAGAADGSITTNVQIPPPDLRRFNQLLPSWGQGDHHHGFDRSTPDDASEAQPQGPQAADHAQRVREAVA